MGELFLPLLKLWINRFVYRYMQIYVYYWCFVCRIGHRTLVMVYSFYIKLLCIFSLVAKVIDFLYYFLQHCLLIPSILCSMTSFRSFLLNRSSFLSFSHSYIVKYIYLTIAKKFCNFENIFTNP